MRVHSKLQIVKRAMQVSKYQAMCLNISYSAESGKMCKPNSIQVRPRSVVDFGPKMNERM